jgi:hypothetical protein
LQCALAPLLVCPCPPCLWFRYVNVDDMLVDLKLPAHLLELPVPRYFVEDRAEEIKNRNKVCRVVQWGGEEPVGWLLWEQG